jgi:hypothetical protein
MFSRRRIVGNNYHWNRDFISALEKDLRVAGYDKITVKLPFNRNQILETLKGLKTEAELKNAIDNTSLETEISFEEFLARERNFPAIILVIQNPKTGEMIKMLFVNRSIKAEFLDDIFPSVQSGQTEIYVQSSDPARVVPLIDFLYSYITQRGDSVAGTNLVGFTAFLVFVFEVFTFITRRSGFLHAYWKFSGFYDLGLFILCFWILYNFQTLPVGLSVNNRETQTLNSYLRRILVGDYKDNPIVILVLTIIVTILSNLVVTFLGF